MEWLTDIFLPFGFVAVGQDMRGTELSEGNFTMWQSDKWDSEVSSLFLFFNILI